MISQNNQKIINQIYNGIDSAAAANPIDLPNYTGATAVATAGLGTLASYFRVDSSSGIDPGYFRYNGGTPIYATGTVGNRGYKFLSAYTLNADNIANAANLPIPVNYRQLVAKISWLSDAPIMEIGVGAIGTGSWRLLINGEYLNRTPAFFSANQNQIITVTNGTGSAADRVPRLYELELADAVAFYGVRTGINDTVSKPFETPLINATFVGDSFDQGTGSTLPTGSTAGVNSWCLQFARLVQWDSVQLAAIGGTGYIATNTGTQRPYIDRITDTLAQYNHVIVISGGYNDASGNTGSQIADAATLYWNAVRALNPDSLIVVTGIWSPPNGNASAKANEPLLKAAFNAWADPFSIFIPVATASTPIFFGTGFNQSGSSDGNSYYYIGADGTHPLDAGHAWLGRRIAATFISEFTRLFIRGS